MKFRTLRADEIEVKVKQIKSTGFVALLYKTARTDMDMLDETVGPENWQCEYETIKENLYCKIGISVLCTYSKISSILLVFPANVASNITLEF